MGSSCKVKIKRRRDVRGVIRVRRRVVAPTLRSTWNRVREIRCRKLLPPCSKKVKRDRNVATKHLLHRRRQRNRNCLVVPRRLWTMCGRVLRLCDQELRQILGTVSQRRLFV